MAGGRRHRAGKPAPKQLKPVPSPPDDALAVRLVAPKLAVLPDLQGVKVFHRLWLCTFSIDLR